MPRPATKACPFCAERILAQAKKCKHCHEILDPSLVQGSRQDSQFSPGVAALLSFILPGAGQIYRGKVFAGLAWFVSTLVGYVLFIVPGLVLHITCIFAAASGARTAGRAGIHQDGADPVPANTSGGSDPRMLHGVLIGFLIFIVSLVVMAVFVSVS